MKYPISKEDVFFPEGPSWTEELMMFCLDGYPSFEKVLDKMNNIVSNLNNKNKSNENKKQVIKSKKNSSEESEEMDDEEEEDEDTSNTDLSLSNSGMFRIDEITHFAMSDKELEELKDYVSDACDLLGDDIIYLEEDVASVIMVINIKNIMNEDYANSYGKKKISFIH